MRTVPMHEFWEAVYDSVGAEAYEELMRKFSGDTTFATADAAEEYWRKETLPIMRKACRINGCVGTTFYLESTLQAIVEAARKEPRLLGDTDNPKTKMEVDELKEDIVKPVYRGFEDKCAAEHRCHFSENEDLVCYCDETSPVS